MYVDEQFRKPELLLSNTKKKFKYSWLPHSGRRLVFDWPGKFVPPSLPPPVVSISLFFIILPWFRRVRFNLFRTAKVSELETNDREQTFLGRAIVKGSSSYVPAPPLGAGLVDLPYGTNNTRGVFPQRSKWTIPTAPLVAHVQPNLYNSFPTPANRVPQNRGKSGELPSPTCLVILLSVARDLVLLSEVLMPVPQVRSSGCIRKDDVALTVPTLSCVVFSVDRTLSHLYHFFLLMIICSRIEHFSALC